MRCSGELSADQFWTSALESLNFSRIAEVSNAYGLGVEAKIGVQGEAGWSWLAKAMASFGFSISGTSEYSIQRQFAHSNLSARHLIPLLKGLPVQLVVEDFHYLTGDTKVEVFQQWKSFTDEGVSVVVVSTSHHTVDIARSNPDLTGRMRLIDVGKWSEEDLAKIPTEGFPLLEYSIVEGFAQRIARESVGLPIIAQQLCQSISHEIEVEMAEDDIVPVEERHIEKAQHYVAQNLYSSHENDYQQLANGPRRRARKHATYEKILSSFALEPIVFSLEYSELIERVGRLKTDSEDPIPPASINAALKAMAGFQKRSKMNLLEWQESEKRLYILEPSFLFYLRQKLDNVAPGQGVTAALLKLLSRMEIELKSMSAITGTNGREE